VIDRSIADEAGKLVGGERNDQYGPPEVALLRIAGLWSGYLGFRINASDVAKMMMLLKLARTMDGKYKRDSFVDGVAYLLIAEGLDNGGTE
jgi:hypothetical protein